MTFYCHFGAKKNEIKNASVEAGIERTLRTYQQRQVMHPTYGAMALCRKGIWEL